LQTAHYSYFIAAVIDWILCNCMQRAKIIMLQRVSR